MKLDVFTLLTVFPQMNMNTLNMSLEMVHLSKQLHWWNVKGKKDLAI